MFQLFSDDRHGQPGISGAPFGFRVSRLGKRVSALACSVWGLRFAVFTVFLIDLESHAASNCVEMTLRYAFVVSECRFWLCACLCLCIEQGSSALSGGLELLWHLADTAGNQSGNVRSSSCEASCRMLRQQLSILPSVTGAEHYSRIWRRLLLLLHVAASRLRVFWRGFHRRLVDSEWIISARWFLRVPGRGRRA